MESTLKLGGVVRVEAADVIIRSAELIECSESFFFRTVNGGLDGLPICSHIEEHCSRFGPVRKLFSVFYMDVRRHVFSALEKVITIASISKG